MKVKFVLKGYFTYKCKKYCMVQWYSDIMNDIFAADTAIKIW